MSTPDVMAATAEDRERVVSAIVLAFVGDPVARWAWPEPHDYLTYFPGVHQGVRWEGVRAPHGSHGR